MTISVPLTEKEIDEELNKLQLTKHQRKFVREKGEILAKKLQMTATENELTGASELTGNALTENRINSAKEIFSIFREKVNRVLKVKGKDKLLDDAIDAALEYYTENYANRHRDTE